MTSAVETAGGDTASFIPSASPSSSSCGFEREWGCVECFASARPRSRVKTKCGEMIIKLGQASSKSVAGRWRVVGAPCAGPSALGSSAIGDLGLRPRLVCAGPSALDAKLRRVCLS